MLISNIVRVFFIYSPYLTGRQPSHDLRCFFDLLVISRGTHRVLGSKSRLSFVAHLSLVALSMADLSASMIDYHFQSCQNRIQPFILRGTKLAVLSCDKFGLEFTGWNHLKINVSSNEVYIWLRQQLCFP